MGGRIWALGIGLAVAVALSGCAHDGRDMQPPSRAAPVTTPTTAAGAASSTSAGAVISPGAADGEPQLLSAAFNDGQPIPINHTCDGADVSPPLAWSAVPVGTVELAIAVIDSDAADFVHWVIAKLDPNRTTLGAAETPAGSVQATNGFERPGYGGPCPPSGTHHYVFTLYALATPSGIIAGEPGRDAIARLDAASTTAKVTLTGTYARP